MGNRTTDDKTSTTWSYNKNNELQSFDNTSFKYNKNGQMIEKTVNGTKTYYRDNLDGRLKEIKDHNQQVIAIYQYDPFGRRISKALPQNINQVIYFHFSDEGLIAEYNQVADLIQSYGYKPNSFFTTNPLFTHRADITEEKGYAFYINDHLATPQKLILRNGRTVWEASADAFGRLIVTSNEFTNSLRFSGQYYDTESTLTYNYKRYYDANLGRYLRSDPIKMYGGINEHVYVDANPIVRVDPFGLWWTEGDGENDWGNHPNNVQQPTTGDIPDTPLTCPVNVKCKKTKSYNDCAAKVRKNRKNCLKFCGNFNFSKLCAGNPFKKVNARIVGDKKTNGFLGEIIIPNVCEEIAKRSVDNVCKLYCVNNNQPGKICIDKNIPCDFLM